jgi:hypothetical protein
LAAQRRSVLWFGLSIAVAIRAKHRNRSFWGWLFLSVIFSPLITVLFVFLLPPRDPERPRMIEMIEAKTVEGRKLGGAIAFCVSLAFIIVFIIAGLGLLPAVMS